MRKRTKFLLIAIGVILALTVGITTAAFASGSSTEETNADSTVASITLDPTSGAASTLVTVTATGFAANSDLTLTFDGTQLACTETSVTTDGDGSASGTFTVPVKAAGDYEVTVTDGVNSASATFEEKSSPEETFISKVADILGLPADQVAAAFKQARQEMQDEALQNRLEKLVDEGKITQDEADQYLEWWQSRPDIAGLGDFGFGVGMEGGRGFGHGGGRCSPNAPD